MSTTRPERNITSADSAITRQELAENGSLQVGDGAEIQGDDSLFSVLLYGGKVTAAATAAGVSERTAYRRMSDPRFRQRLEQARATVRDSVVQRLNDAAGGAVDCLWKLIEHEDVSACRHQRRFWRALRRCRM